MKKRSYPPLLATYLKKYQQDPHSRVFAPLAEAYRKAGLIDDAIEIAREGLLIHPGFLGGKVALARALFDKKLFSEVSHLLIPVMRDMPDNIVAQRLLADSFLMLGRSAEALNSYKTLLYFIPEDRELAQIVKELECRSYEEGTALLLPKIVENPVKDLNWIKKIETLQLLLQKVERYRVLPKTQ